MLEIGGPALKALGAMNRILYAYPAQPQGCPVFNLWRGKCFP